MIRRLLAVLAFLAGFHGAALAFSPDELMADPAQEARARAITRELRCVVCQGESVDDSGAEIARDLRLYVRREITAGRSDAEIVESLRARYGDFVLMRPRFEFGTFVLWGAPAAVLVLGFFAARRHFGGGGGGRACG